MPRGFVFSSSELDQCSNVAVQQQYNNVGDLRRGYIEERQVAAAVLLGLHSCCDDSSVGCCAQPLVNPNTTGVLQYYIESMHLTGTGIIYKYTLNPYRYCLSTIRVLEDSGAKHRKGLPCRSTTFHIITVYITTFQITTFVVTTFHITAFHITTINFTIFHFTALHITTFHFTTWHGLTQVQTKLEPCAHGGSKTAQQLVNGYL